MRLALIIVLALLLAACGRKDVKPDVPRGIIVQPKIINVTRTVYVNVPDTLTDPLPVAEGPLSICPDVAAARGATIRKANADRKATRALSGTEAKP